MRDWTGNTKSLFTTNGDSSHSNREREISDYYATDPRAVEHLLDLERFSNDIWEPACGEGHISKVMEQHGHFVRSTDLVDRGFGEGGIDFLMQWERWYGDIVTNPPYKLAQEFVETAMELIADGRKVAMFLKLTFLEGQARQALFTKYPPPTGMGVGASAGVPDERRVRQRQGVGGVLCMVRMGERVQGQARNRMVQLGVQAVEDSMAEK